MPPEGVGMAPHYGAGPVLGVWLASFVVAVVVAVTTRHITLTYVGSHWAYRVALFLFAPGLLEYKKHGTLVAGEVGDLFLIVSGSGSVWGWILALALAEVHLWFA